MSDDARHVTPIVFSVIAAIGGVARYSVSYLDGQPFSFTKFVASVFVSGFAGLMFGYFGISLGLKNEILFVFSGIGGFSGTASIHYLFDQITRREREK